MAGRPWRTAGFADLRDNNNDVEMPDTRAGVSRLPHSSRHQREGIYGVTPRPPPSTPDVRAMAEVNGISVDFRPQEKAGDAAKDKEKANAEPAKDKEKNREQLYDNGIAAFSKDSAEATREFLKLLTEMRTIPQGGKSYAFDLSLDLVLSPALSWVTMQTMMYNFFFDTEFKRKLEGVQQSRLRQVVEGILQRKKDKLDGAMVAEGLGLFNPMFSDEFPVRREAESPINGIELKSIIDAINVASANLRNAASDDKRNVSAYEPPFFPRLSDDERMMVWNWVNLKQTAMETIYKDEFYQFAVTVAGMVGLSDFGLDKLITSAFRQSPTPREYKDMPSTIADDPFLSSERDALFGQIASLNQALVLSKQRDKLAVQREYNKIKDIISPSEVNDKTGRADELLQARQEQIGLFGAEGNESYVNGAKLYPMDKEAPKSPQTVELELRVKALEGLTSAFVSENSRQRMLWAVKWMMQPEILKRAELQPLFSAAIQQALFRVRSMCPALRNVTKAEMFYTSPDSMVVTAFAELVAQQITRTQFFHPTRVHLDKTHDRNQQMETRLKYAMRNFRFNGTHVLSEFSSSNSSETCSALYAF